MSEVEFLFLPDVSYVHRYLSMKAELTNTQTLGSFISIEENIFCKINSLEVGFFVFPYSYIYIYIYIVFSDIVVASKYDICYQVV